MFGLLRARAPSHAHLRPELSVNSTNWEAQGWQSVRAALVEAGSGAYHDWESYPHEYKLWRWEDLNSWIVFGVVFTVLIIFDNVVLHRSKKALPFRVAVLYCLFWLLCAAAFCFYIYQTRGYADAMNWWTGYLLEWMLSIDNLFVFRSIFLVFKTPDDQKHKPLMWGIVGAVVFRMGFFVAEELLVHKVPWMHLILGAFLIYTGVRMCCCADTEAHPEETSVVHQISQYVPFVNSYSPEGKFFSRVPVDAHGQAILPDWIPPVMPQTPRTLPDIERTDGVPPEQGAKQFRATRLLLVVVCLEVTDVLFAVDSVSAIVAQIPDLFLAYTACVFAMLGLRATFFVVDELVKLFSLLGYAVACIMIFLGVKLLLHRWVKIPPQFVCIGLVATMALSVAASLAYDRACQRPAADPPEHCPEEAPEPAK